MCLLELESAGERRPDGVVLALVGGDQQPSREQEGMRAIRMYNLASLINLAKWATSNRASLELRTPDIC
jgi:hypothetical protein